MCTLLYQAPLLLIRVSSQTCCHWPLYQLCDNGICLPGELTLLFLCSATTIIQVPEKWTAHWQIPGVYKQYGDIMFVVFFFFFYCFSPVGLHCLGTGWN